MRSKLALASAALLLAGCGDITSTDLAALSGVYVLRSIDASPVPVLQRDDTYGRQYMLADTLFFDGRGTAIGFGAIRVEETGQPPEVYHFTQKYTYTVRGHDVQFYYDCPPNALCAVPPVGWLKPGSTLALARPSYPSGFGPLSLYEHVR